MVSYKVMPMLFYVLCSMPLARWALKGAHWAVRVGEKVISKIRSRLESSTAFHASVQECAPAVQTWGVMDGNGVGMVLFNEVVF